MHHTDLPRRQDADDLDAELERRQQRAAQANTEMWHRRLAWGIPVVALFVALVGVLAILAPPFPSPGQGVRRIAPEAPPSAAPTPAPVPGPTTRPCGAPGAAPEDYRSSLVAACDAAHGELVSWAGEDGFSEPQCWRVGESEPVPLHWRAGP